MALQAFKGTFNLNTATGNQSITGVGFQPLAVIFFATKNNATGFAANANITMGFATSSTNRQSTAQMAVDNVATSSAGRRYSSIACVFLISTGGGTPTINTVADFVSNDADGFTINLSTAPATGWTIHYLALGGSDLTNAKTGTWTTSGVTGNQSFTGVGFKPDFILHMGWTVLSNSGNWQLSLGAASSTSTANQIAASWRLRDATVGTGIVRGYQRSDKFYAVNGAAGIVEEGTLSSFDADGATLNLTTDSGNSISYLAFKGGRYYAGSETQKTSTGIKANTSVGFTPNGLFFFGSNRAASAAIYTSGNMGMSIGAASFLNSVPSQGNIWNGHTPGTTTQADQYSDVTNYFTNNTVPSTVNSAATMQSRDGVGYTANYTTADGTAREQAVIGFGSNNQSRGYLNLLGVGR